MPTHETEVTDTEELALRGEREVHDLLEAFAVGLTSGNGAAVARLWAVPSLVIHDEAVRPVSSLAEVEQFFGSAKEQYNAKGIVSTRPDVTSLNWATDRIALVQVRWPYLDAAGDERASESSTYVLRRGEDSKLRIQAVVMHGVQASSH